MQEAEAENPVEKQQSESCAIDEEQAVADNNADDAMDAESDVLDDENDEEGKENYEGFNGTGRTVTLQTLMSANVLQPGKSTMTIEYLGQKFVGDLLPDGKIKSQETETIFLTPSAWAMHCKRIINPEKKSGCGWASVKYKGKKLDAYKNSWLRKCALQKDSTPDEDGDKKSESPIPVVKRTVYPHSTITNRNIMHDANMLIEAVPFSSVGKLQPFLLTISSSALLLADFHCHLTMHEVCGYLAGNWDVNSHTLAITKAYPCRNTRFDRSKAAEVEREIQKLIIRDQLILVGWYHSHPQFQAEPTLRDIDSQLEYQIRMRGPSDLTYTPCVSLIISPYYDSNPTLESVVKSIWVVPPNENKQSLEYGRPMLMQYSVLADKEVPEDVRNEMQTSVDYYARFRNELVRFGHIYHDDTTYIEKLKNTLYPKFPVKQSDKELWNYICAVLGCDEEDDFIPPKTIKIIDNDTENSSVTAGALPLAAAGIDSSTTTGSGIGTLNDNEEETNSQEAASVICSDLKLEPSKEEAPKLEGVSDEAIRKAEEQAQAEQKASELKVLSLQEQLCLPSGLNMNPVRMLSPLATPNPTATPTPAALPPIVPPVAGQPSISNTLAPASLLPPLPPAMPLASAGLPPSSVQVPSVPSAVAPPPAPACVPTTAPAPLPPAAVAATVPVAVAAPSPRDSPITIPSNSASPAKFEVPVRASPSPARSDASSHTSRTRNSPAPSPGKFSISDIARNSPSITPNKYEPPGGLVPPSASCLPTANDLMAASLAQLAGQLPPNFLQTDLAALFQQQHQHQTQQQRKDYGNSSLNQLAAAAAKVGAQKQNQLGVGSSASAADLSDPNVAAAVAAYSNSFNMPRMQESNVTPSTNSKSKSERSSKSTAPIPMSNNTSSNSYKTKLMKELDDLKNDPLKMSELMRSPEYAALLLQQAEALGATTLGSLGFGGDFNYLTGAGLGMTTSSGGVGNSSNSSNNTNSSGNASSSGSGGKSSKSSAAAAAASAAALTADYNNLIQASKLLGYDSYMQQAKTNDINAFLQQQMGAAAAAAAAAASASPSTTKKQQQQQQQQQQQSQVHSSQSHPDYTTLLQTYSKLFDPSNQFGAAAAMGPVKGAANAHHELSALLAAGVGGMASTGGASGSSSAKQKQKDVQAQVQQQQTDMLNQLLQSEKQQSDLNALLYHQNKAAVDLNAIFAAPSASASASSNKSGGSTAGSGSGSGSGSSSNPGSTGAASPLTDPAAYYNALAQEKMQDYAAFFQQQHGKYGIPDPLSKSTLAANNLFMSPSALLKIQQDSLSAMMMKPPKSTSSPASSLGRTRESSASPALERLTPTKSGSVTNMANMGNMGNLANMASMGNLANMANVGNVGATGLGPKYNFSAVDLAISSVSSNTPSPAPSDGSNSSSHRRPSNTPPVDLSRLYGDLAPPITKKRMEFSSIADLAAPPPAKMPKTSDDVLNYSNE